MRALHRLSNWVGTTFVWWALAFAILAYFVPGLFFDLAFLIKPALMLIRFGMGLTLQARDFAEVFRRPWQVLLGIGAQYLLMPLIAVVLAYVLRLDPTIALGLILVGCCPGGTSSNVITYLARGDVPLSITITSCSTLLTPLLLQFYAGAIVEVNTLAMMKDIAQIIVLPIVAGVTLHLLLGKKIEPAMAVTPMISVFGIVFVIAVVIARSSDHLAASALIIFCAVILHNLIGYAMGYGIARILGMSVAQRRAIMVEVGMQNSGLGASLAQTFFAANPLTAVPSAIFSLWHNISGALVASYCTRLDRKRGL